VYFLGTETKETFVKELLFRKINIDSHLKIKGVFLLMIYTEDKLCAENAEEWWKRIKKFLRSVSKLYLSISLQRLCACESLRVSRAKQFEYQWHRTRFVFPCSH
jgi:hypothetical protein